MLGSAGPSTRRGESYRAGPAVGGSGIPSGHLQHELDPSLFKRESRLGVGDPEDVQPGPMSHTLFRYSSADSVERERGGADGARGRYE